MCFCEVECNDRCEVEEVDWVVSKGGSDAWFWFEWTIAGGEHKSEYDFECGRSDSLDDKEEKPGGRDNDYDELRCKRDEDPTYKRDLTPSAETILSSLGDICQLERL